MVIFNKKMNNDSHTIAFWGIKCYSITCIAFDLYIKYEGLHSITDACARRGKFHYLRIVTLII